jgi:cell division protease FtsH
VVFHTATTGASNDIERATELARKMITMYGMSEKFGIMGLATIQSQYLDQGYGLTCAQDTAAVVDREIAKLMEKCHQEARQILEENRELLDKIAEYLLEKETITGQEMMAIIEGRDPALVDNYGATPELPRRSNRAVPATDHQGIEKPAKKINMVSQKPASPSAYVEDESVEPSEQETKADSESES